MKGMDRCKRALQYDRWLPTQDLQHFSTPGSEDPPRGEGLVRGWD